MQNYEIHGLAYALTPSNQQFLSKKTKKTEHLLGLSFYCNNKSRTTH